MDFNQQDIRRFLLEAIPSRFKSLNQEEFRDFVKYLFEVDGYEMLPGVQTGDLSNLLLARKDGETLIIQSFRNEAEVLIGETDVYKAQHARSFYATTQAWILTTSSFSDEARKLAESSEIELWDWDALYDALCTLFFEGKEHHEFVAAHPLPPPEEIQETELKLKVKWQATEGVGSEWYNMGLTVTNPSDRNIYLHLELPVFIDTKGIQWTADQWGEHEFVSGLLYAKASVKTNALFSVSRLGERPPGGRIVLTCHERRDVPVTYHLHSRLKGEACFVVTYCYTRQSPEYRAMILFRDEVLSRSLAGKWFIAIYYLVSPILVRWAGMNKMVDRGVRRLTALLIPIFLRKVIQQKKGS